jgi:hypothetical protein
MRRAAQTAGRTLFVLASLALPLVGTGGAQSQAKGYVWTDIDCRQSRIVAWPGLKCRSTNVVTGEGNIGEFRQWSAFGTGPGGHYVHIFVWEALNTFSYIPAADTTAEFVKWMFEDGKSASHMSPVMHYKAADYITLRDDSKERTCVGFRRLGSPQRGGYASLTGGILCAAPGKTVAESDVTLFIDSVRLLPDAEQRPQ